MVEFPVVEEVEVGRNNVLEEVKEKRTDGSRGCWGSGGSRGNGCGVVVKGE